MTVSSTNSLKPDMLSTISVDESSRTTHDSNVIYVSTDINDHENDNGYFKIPYRRHQVRMILYFNKVAKWTRWPAFVLHWAFKRPVKMVIWPVGMALANDFWFEFTLWVVIWSALFDSIITHTIKDAMYMPRPQWVVPSLRKIRHATSSSYSFPSGHTHAVSNVLFMTAYHTGKWYMFLVWLLATLIMGVSRTALAVHWPQDVMAGALTGVVTGIVGILVNPQRFQLDVKDFSIYVASLTLMSSVFVIARYYVLNIKNREPIVIESLEVQVKQHNTFTDMANILYVASITAGTALKWELWGEEHEYTMIDAGWPLAYHIFTGSVTILFVQHILSNFFDRKYEPYVRIPSQALFGLWHSIGANITLAWLTGTLPF